MMTALPGNVAHYLFSIVGLDSSLRLVSLRGKEALSQPYRFDLDLMSENPDLDFDDIVGRPGFITFKSYESEFERHINGIINKFEQSKQGRRFTTYHVELVPSLWLLSYRANLRIYQGKSVVSIIESVLLDAGISADQFSFVLQSKYQNRDYCVQYRESDLAFISRLMEEEGLFYYFEHTENNHVLTIADNGCVHKSIALPTQIPFHVPAGLNVEEEFISEISFSQEIRPGKVSLQDYNYSKPQLTLLSEEVAENNTELELYDYPAEHQTTEKGAQLARVRLEESQVIRRRIKGKSNCRRLLPGYWFALQDHPRDSFNRHYLVTTVYHEVKQPGVLEEEAINAPTEYGNRFECIPVDAPYRAQRLTSKPVVEGVQTAVVVGPADEEIYTDEYGRVKVQFHWDREGQNNEHSSCWIRVSQMAAGCGWGAMFIPRIGHEVIVDFIEGDPDRPIITGSVYHGTNMPPDTLPENKTKSTIKTNSTPGSVGANELSFEDKAGLEELNLHAHRNMSITVGRAKMEKVEADSAEIVGMNKMLHVGLLYAVNVFGFATTFVAGANFLKVLADNIISVSGHQNSLVGKSCKLEIGEKYNVRANDICMEAQSEITFKVGSSSLVIDGNSITLSSDKINLKGKIVDVSGSNIVNIKGALVKIN